LLAATSKYDKQTCNLQHVGATCCVLTWSGKQLELANRTFLLAVLLASCRHRHPHRASSRPKSQLAAQLITHTRAVHMCHNSCNTVKVKVKVKSS